MRLRNAWLVAVMGLAVIIAVGCDRDEPGPPASSALPDGAIALTLGQPHSGFDGLTVAAANIDEAGAFLSMWDPSDAEPGTSARVEIGGTMEFAGTTLQLVATWVDPDPGEGDGGSRTKAWVVVEK